MTDWERARRALYRFCANMERMCIPVREYDDDRVLARALDAGAEAEARAARLEAALQQALTALDGTNFLDSRLATADAITAARHIMTAALAASPAPAPERREAEAAVIDAARRLCRSGWSVDGFDGAFGRLPLETLRQVHEAVRALDGRRGDGAGRADA